MEFEWDSFIEAYKNADAATKSVVDSTYIAECVEENIQKGFANRAHQELLIIAVTQRVLNATNEDTAVKILTNHGVTFAKELLQKLLQCVSEKNTFIAKDIPPALELEIAKAEQDFAALPNIHTKPLETVEVRPVSDVVYQSSQADILQRPAPVVNNLVPHTPRWDTDTQK
jgi:hypothetical protein